MSRQALIEQTEIFNHKINKYQNQHFNKTCKE